MGKTGKLVIALIIAFAIGFASALVLPEKYSPYMPVAIGVIVGAVVRKRL